MTFSKQMKVSDLFSEPQHCTLELVLRPSVAAPYCRGDAEPDLG